MGHREDLLVGAKKCLLERGYAQTTARDIVAASGTNLASIGYHFGSKEALLTQAMMELMGEWGDRMAPRPTLDGLTYPERFERLWEGVIAALGSDRNLAIASFENFMQAMRTPGLGPIIAAGQEEGRQGMAADFADPDQPADQAAERAVGSLMMAITTGVISQWLVDLERAPTAKDLTRAFEYLARAFGREASEK